MAPQRYPPLTRIVLRCPTEAQATLAGSRGEVAEALAQHADGVLAVGDQVAALGHQVSVLECYPTSKGRVTDDSIVILLGGPADQAPSPQRRTAPAVTAPKSKVLALSSFCRPRYRGDAVPSFQCSTHTHPWDPDFGATPSRLQAPEWSAAVSPATGVRMQWWDGALAEVEVEAQGKRFGVTIAFSDACPDEELILHPDGYFNIFRSRFPFVDEGTDGTLRGTLRILDPNVPKDKVPVAQSIKLASVASPSLVEVPTELADAALFGYFAEDRRVHCGDILAIPVPTTAPESTIPTLRFLTDCVLDPAAPLHHTVYFKVVDIVTDNGPLLDHPRVPLLQRTAVVRKGVTALAVVTPPVPSPVPPRAPSLEFPIGVLPPYRRLVDTMRRVLAVDKYQGSLLLTGCELNYTSFFALVAAAGVGCHTLCVDSNVVDFDEVPRLLRIARDAAPAVVVLREVQGYFNAKQKKAGGGSGGGKDNVTAPLMEALQESPGVILVCLAPSDEGLPGSFVSAFQEVVSIESPSTDERRLVFSELLKRVTHSKAVTPDTLARSTAGLPYKALTQVSVSAARHCVSRVTASLDFDLTGIPRDARLVVTHADFTVAIEGYTKTHQVNVSMNVQKVGWKDIGGLRGPKEEILQCLHLPLQQPHLLAQGGLKARTGIIMFGPPGCGKTLLAKGVATECGLNFMSVKGPELISMYVGESEKNIRDLFNKARQAAPCVVFFDELDALAPNRGINGDSGGVMDRIVAQLLAEVDGLGGPDKFVFVIGATNRPDLLDQSLLRPGRFDRCVYLGVSETSQEQATILKAQTRKMNLAPDVSLLSLAESMTKNYSGADMYAICTEALMLAMREKMDELMKRVEERKEQQYSAAKAEVADRSLDSSDEEGEEQAPADSIASIEVRQEHFLTALKSCTPSITPETLARYEALRKKFMGGDDKAP
eukprot:Sspe_Gene.15349::Locus_5344_Transcript_1_2_Confidence_0.800_Length_3013::g.15349::m.15349/K13339/PEX6, PXAAA1; peroxin-6